MNEIPRPEIVEISTYHPAMGQKVRVDRAYWTFHAVAEQGDKRAAGALDALSRTSRLMETANRTDTGAEAAEFTEAYIEANR